MNPATLNVLDAGMGKALSMRGVIIPPTIWSANALLTAPDVVLDIHRENIDAGAGIITTNSYGIIRSDLAKEGIEDQFAALNRQAGELAQQAVRESGKSIAVAGSLPPLNGSYRPDLVQDSELITALYREQAELLAPYVDVFICETMSTIAEAVAAATGAGITGKPVLIALTLHDEKSCLLRSGESLEDALQQLKNINIAGVLANCCLPERIDEAMPLLAGANLDYCGGYANAFSHVPTDWLLDGDKQADGALQLRKDLSPDVYCRFVARWVDQGANMVGGCCGTTAAHTAAIASTLGSH
ncbi:MAG: S-methylmethionine-dependent homocysteine/selenocysteine methylase [Paraglaciecola psychrophila]|jgi:S-methylmethionine-dependent homocysteine/selenocysteine methylase